MWDYYDGKCVLITGGSGFLGTAIVYRLVTRTAASPVYILCRGGRRALYAKWRQSLQAGFADTLCRSNCLLVLDGDIVKSNMGLSDSQISIVRHDVEIVIHAASSINLTSSLPELAPLITKATETVAQFALTCPLLRRFVYVSTAYANAHLAPRSELSDVAIGEKIYQPSQQLSSMAEWEAVQKTGTSSVYEAEDYPWTYAYAKYLTEWLLFRWFSDGDAVGKLLVVRPSIIGPAQQVPYPGYCFPSSTPTTSAAAAFLLSKDSEIRVTTRCSNPDAEVHMDEVPVDVVVDRLISHVALGTSGFVHAVSGKRARINYVEWWQAVMQLRRIPWKLKIVWVYENWKTPNQHPISRLWVALGSCFCFSEDRTVAIAQQLVGDGDCSDLQLFATAHMGRQLLGRAEHIRSAMDEMAAKRPRDAETIRTYYRDFGRERHENASLSARL